MYYNVYRTTEHDHDNSKCINKFRVKIGGARGGIVGVGPSL